MNKKESMKQYKEVDQEYHRKYKHLENFLCRMKHLKIGMTSTKFIDEMIKEKKLEFKKLYELRSSLKARLGIKPVMWEEENEERSKIIQEIKNM